MALLRILRSRIGHRHPKKLDGFFSTLQEDAGLIIWYPAEGFAEQLSQMATTLGVLGVRIFDLQIALIALENGASEIWSHDTAFVSIPGLQVYDPIV